MSSFGYFFGILSSGYGKKEFLWKCLENYKHTRCGQLQEHFNTESDGVCVCVDE